jgi:putative spermidine/putrescine transport system ATP-binding protein
MTTNTARNAAVTVDAVERSGSGGGTSVLLHDLTRSFGGTRALDGLSIEMAPGELVALLGPSGCGKTTALRIVAGFETADTGSVLIDGQDISSVPAAKRDMGMVFQSYSLFPNMPALDNVAFGLRMRKIGAAERRQRAAGLLDMVGLDAKVRLQLREQIRTLQQQLGTTTLFVTHDQEEALSMADRVGVMSNGRLEQIAAPDELYTNPATAFVAEFVGVMNRVPGELRGDGTVTALGRTVPVRGESPDGTAVDVLVRPEGLALEVAEHGNGIVTTRTFLGSVTRVGVQLDGDVAVLLDRPSAESAALAPGSSVSVSLPGQPVLVTPRRG